VRGQHWYLYLITDIYSRKIVAWEIHDAEFCELARKLVERALLLEGCWQNPPVLHSDGAPMTSFTLRARLAELGTLMSHSPLLLGIIVSNGQILPGVASKGFKLHSRST
jgi:putative transposase